MIILKEKLMRFMYGRYGVDNFSRFLILLTFITAVSANIFDSRILSMLSWACLFYAYFRIFSKSIYKRTAENQAFLKKTAGIRTWFYKQKSMMAAV